MMILIIILLYYSIPLSRQRHLVRLLLFNMYATLNNNLIMLCKHVLYRSLKCILDLIFLLKSCDYGYTSHSQLLYFDVIELSVCVFNVSWGNKIDANMAIIDYNSLKCKTEKLIKITKYRDSNTLLFIINIILT